jgi:hypothetical protein
MPHRKTQALAALVLATALATTPTAHAAPLETTTLLTRLASLVERAWSWVLPPAAEQPGNIQRKRGPYPDPDGQPQPNHLEEGPFPDPNG